MFNRLFLYTFIAALAAGAGLFAAQKLLTSDTRRDLSAPSQNPSGWPATQAVQAYPRVREIPPFTLQTANNQTLSNDIFKGKWTVVFVGFTHCPDICPSTLARFAVVQKQWETLPPDRRPQLLFISIDPERDTPDMLQNYAQGFYPQTMTGTAQGSELEKLMQSLLMVYIKVPGANFSQNPSDYSMDHSAGMAIINPQGQLAGFARAPLEAQAVGDDLVVLTNFFSKEKP